MNFYFYLFYSTFCCYCRRRCCCFVPFDLLMRCKVTVLSVVVSDTKTAPYANNVIRIMCILIPKFGTIHFISFRAFSPSLLLLLLFSIFPLYFAYYFFLRVSMLRSTLRREWDIAFYRNNKCKSKSYLSRTATERE